MRIHVNINKKFLISAFPNALENFELKTTSFSTILSTSADFELACLWNFGMFSWIFLFNALFHSVLFSLIIGVLIGEGFSDTQNLMFEKFTIFAFSFDCNFFISAVPWPRIFTIWYMLCHIFASFQYLLHKNNLIFYNLHVQWFFTYNSRKLRVK